LCETAQQLQIECAISCAGRRQSTRGGDALRHALARKTGWTGTPIPLDHICCDFTHDARNTSGGLQKSDAKDEAESLTAPTVHNLSFKQIAFPSRASRSGNSQAAPRCFGMKRPRFQVDLKPGGYILKLSRLAPLKLAS
jgi:hypothetical protein